MRRNLAAHASSDKHIDVDYRTSMKLAAHG